MKRIFNWKRLLFWRKKKVMPIAEPVVAVCIDGMMCLDGFSCKCHAVIFDNRTYCIVCKRAYTLRILDVAKWHREAKQRLAKILEYDDVADLLKETTEKIAQDSTLSPREVFLKMLNCWRA